MPAEGTKFVTVTHADANGEDRATRVSGETWVNPELRVILLHTVDDSEAGKTTEEVTELHRGDQDPALFKVPEGYRPIDRNGEEIRPK
jgi:hypothetical protein